MRILVITNFYPPHHLGGMGITCKSTTQALRRKGHKLHILTSNYRHWEKDNEKHVVRSLSLETLFLPLLNSIRIFFQPIFEARDTRILRKTIREFNPDVIFIWGMWNLHRAIALLAEDLTGGRVLYRFGDYWPIQLDQASAYWKAPARSCFSRKIKQLLAPIAARFLIRRNQKQPRFQFSYCISDAVRKKLENDGIPMENSRIIRSGVDIEPFYIIDHEGKWEHSNLENLLFIGRLAPEKGLQIAIDSLDRLRSLGEKFNLTIVGSGDERYIAQVKETISKIGLSGQIRFLGNLRLEDVVSQMAKHQVVLVPSLWEEPLGRVAAEAMAAGSVVIASRVGGLAEIIDSGSTGLLFSPGDGQELAELLSWLKNNPKQARHIARNAKAKSVELFDMEKAVLQIEECLIEASISNYAPGRN